MNQQEKARAFDLACFLANSARGSLEEGVVSSSLRLIDAVSRVAELDSGSDQDNFLKETGRWIKDNVTQDFLFSREKYVSFLDEVASRFGREVARRNGLAKD